MSIVNLSKPFFLTGRGSGSIFQHTGRHGRDRPCVKSPSGSFRRGLTIKSMFVVMRLFAMLLMVVVMAPVLSGWMGMVVGSMFRIMAMGMFMLVAMGMIMQMSVLMVMGIRVVCMVMFMGVSVFVAMIVPVLVLALHLDSPFSV